MWQPDDGSAVPRELGMPGGNATVPNSRRDMQVGLVPITLRMKPSSTPTLWHLQTGCGSSGTCF